MKKLCFTFLACVLATGAGAQAWKFDRVVDTPYPKPNSVTSGDMVVADFTGDGLVDVILAGTLKAKPALLFYKQTKTGFQEVGDHGITALLSGAMLASADFDGDGDIDLAIAGKTGPANETALIQIFFNQGQGQFKLGEDLGGQLPSEDFEDTAASWAPTDTGVKGVVNANGWSKGVFIAVDLNGDNKPDLLFAGSKGLEGGTDAASQRIQREWETGGVFLNQGRGKMTLIRKEPRSPDFTDAGFRKVTRSAGVLADFTGDGKLDFVLTGQANLGPLANAGIPETQRNGMPIGEVYTGLGNGQFQLLAGSSITANLDGAITVTDFNKDGKLDLVLIGSTGHPKDPAGGRIFEIWLGKGNGTFTLDSSQTNLKPLFNGDVALGDLDGDGDLDVVASGNDNTKSLYVYENVKGLLKLLDLSKRDNGIGSNGPTGSAESDASQSTDLVLIDMDNDGDLDILLSGSGGVDQFLVFRNRLK